VPVLRGKGHTNYAIALATAGIIEAILHDEHQVLPVSSLLDDWAGSSDVCLSVPSVVDRTGVLRQLPVPLSPDERIPPAEGGLTPRAGRSAAGRTPGTGTPQRADPGLTWHAAPARG
jgi:hypothetical protein